MNWFYYICQYGPGHQSGDDGFIETTGSTDEVADSLLDTLFRNQTDSIIRVWKINQPPQSFLDEEKIKLENRLSSTLNLLQQIVSQKGSESFTEIGRDSDIMSAIGSDVICHSFVKHLHEKGIIVNMNTVDMWRLGQEKPKDECKKKVLSAIHKCEKYSSYDKPKK